MFQVVKGVKFILNPYSVYGKELIPEEIESLLNGTIYDQLDAHDVEQKKMLAFNELFERAGKKQNGLILLDGYNRKDLAPTDKLKLEDSITDLKACLELFPNHWQSMVLMAKAFQRLDKHAEALEQLEVAFKLELENHFIPMEASLEAMHLKDLDKGLFYSEEALKRKSNDVALLGNHAMNLLIAQKDTESKATIAKAIKLQPNDQINRNIESIITGVIAGNRNRPTFEDTIK